MTIAVFIVYKTNKKILHWSKISFFFNMKRGTGILTPNNYIPYKYKFKVNFLSVQSICLFHLYLSINLAISYIDMHIYIYMRFVNLFFGGVF